MIAVPIVATTAAEARRQIRQAEPLADIIELRLDYLDEPDPLTLINACTKPVIVTCRARRDRGNFIGSETERIRLLQAAVDVGADYVDVELEAVGRIKRSAKSKLIASFHDFERTPEDLDEIHDRLAATKPDVVKLVTHANDIRDNLKLLALTRRSATTLPTIAFAMGERGHMSRILTGAFGGFLTFGSLASGKESAPGQLTANELRELYRYPSIGPDTQLFGVIAKPVAHSMSPAIMNASFLDAQIDACYVPMLVDDAPATVSAFRSLGFAGYSVTLPHKEAVMGALDDIDELARQIGAVNTVVRQPDGSLWGTNTDCAAAIASIEAALGASGQAGISVLKDKRVTIIGARGVARAIGFGLKRAGALITIYNRTVSRAEELAGELDCEFRGLAEAASLQADVVCNATSVGMHPDIDASPVPKSVLKPGMVVFDAVYHPLMTRFLREAESAGCTVVTGLEMFVGQAAEQFRLWTGIDAPTDIMHSVVLEHLTGRKARHD